MIYPESMSYITIAATRNHLEQVIDLLYDMELMHLDDYHQEKPDDLQIGKPLQNAEVIADSLLDVSFIKSVLTLPEKTTKRVSPAQAQRLIREVKKQIHGYKEEQKHAEQVQQQLDKQMYDLEFLQATGIRDATLLMGLDQAGFLAGTILNPAALEEKLKVFPGTVFYETRLEKEYPLIIVTKKSLLDKVKASLGNDWREHHLALGTINTTPADIAKLKQKQQANKEKTHIVKQELHTLEQTVGEELVAAEHALKEQLKKSEVPLRCAVGDQSFLVTGWVPTQQVTKIQSSLAQHTKIYVTVEEDHEHGPTKLENPAAVKPFEFFLNLYSLPRSNEIDPTFLIFLSFPIFYGMMLGDIGYGLILMLLFFALRLKLPEYKGFFDIIILSSVLTVLFGILFGEVFGAEEIAGYHLTPYLHRLHDITELLQLSILFGIIHLNIGILFGFMNEYKHHGLKTAILAKGSWFVLEIAGISLIFEFFFGAAFIPTALAAGLGIVAIGALALGEGVVGIVEIPGLISNALSYARLAAVGLASASLALVVNSMAGSMFAAGGLFIGIGIFILVIGHGINIVVGLLDSFLQSLRLHYVEMFSKFYQGNGKPYNPFGK